MSEEGVTWEDEGVRKVDRWVSGWEGGTGLFALRC